MTDPTDYAFEMAAANLRFGAGATREVGMDLADMGIRRALVVTDPNLAGLPPVRTVVASLTREGIAHDVYDGTRVEPTDASFQAAVDFARGRGDEAFVAVGGGSVIDTAKAVNLYTSHPDDFLAYVNAPAVFCFTAPACPGRHLRAAEMLGADVTSVRDPGSQAGGLLADRIVALMKRLEMPNGLRAVGYTEDDIPALVAGTLPQHRVTKLSPRPADEADLAAMFRDGMVAWQP